MSSLLGTVNDAIKEHDPQKLSQALKNILKIYIEKVGRTNSFKYNKKYTVIAELIQSYISKFEECQMPINTQPVIGLPPIIFLSHSRSDRDYSDTIKDFIVRLNSNESQLMYTADDKLGIPPGEHVFDYLRSKIHQNTFMIILWSERYLNNPACLCELGAAWVLGIEFINIFTPEFDLNNAVFLKCPPMRNEMGIKLGECSKVTIGRLKDKIVKKLNLHIENGAAESAINDFLAKIEQIRQTPTP